MKPGILALLILPLLFAGCASTRQATSANEPRPRLQVTVGVPPTMSVLYEEEVAEAFGYRVASILHEQGFRGHIRYVDRWETPLAGVPVLAIELREWRVDRAGFVDCTFTAELAAASAKQSLGLFHGTSVMTWSRRDWFARADSFEDAARDALSNLAARLEQTGMVDR